MRSSTLATLSLAVAFAAALGTVLILYDIRHLSLISACLTGIITFFVTAIGLGIVAAVASLVLGGAQGLEPADRA